MNGKAQAAMEFIMTYGWAILIVLLAIGTLAYFGVLSPYKVLPERTVFDTPLQNVDNALIDQSAQTIEIAFTNNKGRGINISTDVATIKSIGDCDLHDTAPMEVDYDGTTYVEADGYSDEITNGDTFILRFNCADSNWVIGDKVIVDMVFEYVNVETGQQIPHTGRIDGRAS